MSQEEIRDIYSKIQVQRDQVSEKLRKQMDENINARLTRLFSKYFEMLQKGHISQKQQDDAKRDMSKFLESTVMNSDHDVIMALTNLEIERKYKEKIKNA
jgi:hypothetical protein